MASYLGDITSYFFHACLIHSRCTSLHSVSGPCLILYPRTFSRANCFIWSVLLPDGLQWPCAHHSGPRGAWLDIPPHPLAPPSSLSYPRAWQIIVGGQICSLPFICTLPMPAFVLQLLLCYPRVEGSYETFRKLNDIKRRSYYHQFIWKNIWAFPYPQKACQIIPNILNHIQFYAKR